MPFDVKKGRSNKHSLLNYFSNPSGNAFFDGQSNVTIQLLWGTELLQLKITTPRTNRCPSS